MEEAERFLPIGTICSVRGNNKLMMITGVFSVEYAGNVRMYDYSGCVYPEGMLLRNKICSFNHADIERIQHLGYVTDEYRNFNAMLNRNRDEAEELRTTDVLSNIEFDENGVVVYDPVVSVHSSDDFSQTAFNNLIDRQEIENPFRPIPKAIDNKVDQNDTENWSIFKSIEFDENGVVISAVEA